MYRYGGSLPDKKGVFMRSVLITGAAGGMGREAVSLFRKAGFCVFAVDLAPVAAEDGIIPIQADITSEESLRSAFETVAYQTKELFAILHFAGIYMLHSLVEMKTDAFSRIMDVNVLGAFLVNKMFLPLLRKGSRILMVTSELAPLRPLPFTGVYAVSKSALDRYAYSLALELQLLGISVSVLRAGAVDTGMLEASTRALDLFCRETQLYSFSAQRFRSVVERVEARKITPQKLAQKALAIVNKKKMRFAYAINRNPLLKLFHLCPSGLQMCLLRLILRPRV